MKVIINNTPIFIYWDYTEFWMQKGNKDVCGITVRCFVKKGAGKDQLCYKEIVKSIKSPDGYTNEDKAKGRRDTLDVAVKLLFPNAANKETRRAIWKAYLESQNGNINGTRKSVREILKEMDSFTPEQISIVKKKLFGEEQAGKLITMPAAESVASGTESLMEA